MFVVGAEGRCVVGAVIGGVGESEDVDGAMGAVCDGAVDAFVF